MDNKQSKGINSASSSSSLTENFSSEILNSIRCLFVALVLLYWIMCVCSGCCHPVYIHLSYLINTFFLRALFFFYLFIFRSSLRFLCFHFTSLIYISNSAVNEFYKSFFSSPFLFIFLIFFQWFTTKLLIFIVWPFFWIKSYKKKKCFRNFVQIVTHQIDKKRCYYWISHIFFRFYSCFFFHVLISVSYLFPHDMPEPTNVIDAKILCRIKFKYRWLKYSFIFSEEKIEAEEVNLPLNGLLLSHFKEEKKTIQAR